MREYRDNEISGHQVRGGRLYRTSSVMAIIVEYIGLCFTFVFLFGHQVGHGSMFELDLEGQLEMGRHGVSWGKEVLENTGWPVRDVSTKFLASRK